MATISNKLVAEVMRHKMECKDALGTKGSFYVGTGDHETINSVNIPETTGFDPGNTNNGVLIRDTSDTNTTGWKVAKITTDNLEDGRVEQATNADKAKTLLYNEEYKSFVDAFVSECLSKIYPIGSIYMSATNTNPSAFLGGTWEAWGQGRVPVGVDTNDTMFNTAEKTGGEKTHTLNTTEIPNHEHSMLATYGLNDAGTELEIKGELAYMGEDTSTALRGTGSLHSAAIDHSGLHGPIRAMGLIGESDKPHNNLQPYITCYMWKRTA